MSSSPTGYRFACGPARRSVVVGPNGAGKTSVLNLVTGNLAPDAGRILVDGTDVTGLAAHARARLGIARTYQIPQPFGGMSVFENVLLGATYAGRGRGDGHDPATASVEALELTQLIGRANVMAGALPLLDRKRLELARAVATHPRLLLLDEIAGGLTEGEVDVLVSILRDLRGRGVTIVWIEHIVAGLLAVVDRLVAMDDGRILAEGDPRAVIADPAVHAVYLGEEAIALTLLAVDRVSSFYGDFQALFDVSLTVDEGETVAIIGANGAGKSTLLRLIAGLVPTRGGEVTYNGNVIDGLATHARVSAGISLVPEGRRVFPSLSVDENLQVGAYRRRSGRWDVARVHELFPMLAERRRRSGAVLSGGEQQALAIGRALMANPRLLLLDEVSLGLAPIVIAQLYAALPQIREGGTSILLVEQNIDQALAAADRAYCLLEGRITLAGRPAELSRAAITRAYFGF